MTLGLWQPDIDSILVGTAFFSVYLGLLFAADDLWIDLYAFVKQLKPRRLLDRELSRMRHLPQKRIAIIIANWHEEEVLEPMIAGNVSRLDYLNYTFFLGVYPNDPKTLVAAKKLEGRYREVKVVVNTRSGPTTKGQMLNEIVRGVLEHESANDLLYDVFLMHDSEDVLHPDSLTLINDATHKKDFIQIPIFSFSTKLKKLIGGTYIDEFSENHTKDLLVREAMGAAIPSAGVGTAMSRKFVFANMADQKGDLLREDTLTEDYDLGLNAKRKGFRSGFACAYHTRDDGSWDFIATREYFPDRLNTAIRQKTRWTLGIVFQGMTNLGWSGDLVDKYFLYRDRRGPLNSIVNLLNLCVAVLFTLFTLSSYITPDILMTPAFTVPASMNIANMIYRMIRRALFVRRVNGNWHALLVPIRWPLANFVNMMASVQAIRTQYRSLRTGRAPKWDKTAHVLPAGFGKALPSPPPSSLEPILRNQEFEIIQQPQSARDEAVR